MISYTEKLENDLKQLRIQNGLEKKESKSRLDYKKILQPNENIKILKKGEQMQKFKIKKHKSPEQVRLVERSDRNWVPSSK